VCTKPVEEIIGFDSSVDRNAAAKRINNFQNCYRKEIKK
jgi:hypothetical protein